MKNLTIFGLALFLVGAGLFISCEGPEGPRGPAGAQGPGGEQGEQGPQGPGATVTPGEPSLLHPDAQLVVVGERVQLVLPAGVNASGVTWSSSNNNIATVSSTGVVEAKAISIGENVVDRFQAFGLATITATSGGTTVGTAVIQPTMVEHTELLQLPSLYGQFSRYIPLIGTVFARTLYDNTGMNLGVKLHFNALTAENNQKPNAHSNGFTVDSRFPDVTATLTATELAQVSDSITWIDLAGATTNTGFGRTDVMARSAIGRGFKYNYHVIFWHEQNPTWWRQHVGGTGNSTANSGGSAAANIHGTPMNAQRALKLKEEIVRVIMNRELTITGETKRYKEWADSWEPINEMMLGYPEELTAVGNPRMFDPSRADAFPGAGTEFFTTSGGHRIYRWGHSQFDWKSAMRYGYTAEEARENKRQGSPWVRSIGPDAIYYAYAFARREAPNATLYVNDYDTFRRNKATLIRDLVVELNQRWATESNTTLKPASAAGTTLINGMGMQEHNNIEVTIIDDIRYNLEIWNAVPGVTKMAVTEMDVRVWNDGGDNRAPTNAQQILQSKLYADMFQAYLDFSPKLERVTWWGHTDSGNWMSAGLPTMFRGGANQSSTAATPPAAWAKPQYYMVMNVLEDFAIGKNEPIRYVTSMNTIPVIDPTPNMLTFLRRNIQMK